MIEQQNDSENNTVSFYGYVRGTYLDKHQRIHVNGLGDYEIKSIQRIEDPCPIELKKTVKQKQEELKQDQSAGKKRKRNLKDREKVLYAPFSNIGAMNYENTTGFITIPDKYVVYTRLNEEEGEDFGKEKGTEGQKLVWEMQDLQKAMNENDIEAP